MIHSKNRVHNETVGTETMSLKRRKKRKALNVDENCVSSADVPSQVEVFYFTLQQNPAPKRRRSSKTELLVSYQPPFKSFTFHSINLF